MIRVNISDAEANLSSLIEMAEAGEEVVITRSALSAVRLVPISPTLRRFGALRGKVVVTSAFFDVLRDFE